MPGPIRESRVKIVRIALAVLFAVGLYAALDRPWPVAGARVPPLGRLLDPFAGVWRLPVSVAPPPREVRVPGLTGPVRVVWDDREVPHVFAEDDRDLFAVQGYLEARHRLWQMDFARLAAAGRLSEVLGATTVPLDRLQRRLGVPAGAERALERTMANPATREALIAYARGVNAWIDGLSPRDLPLEYKLLDDRPRAWTPLDSVLVLRSMARILSVTGEDLGQTRLRERFGRAAVEALFPTQAPFVDPIVPPGTPFPFVPRPVARPDVTFPDLDGAPPPMAGGAPVADDADDTGDAPGEPLGSNHWVVAGTRTATGRPLLAGDPHLPLSLPSVWYEIGLAGPDHRVHGVTLPGVPGVVLGFNRHLAWSFTNAYTDVADWRTIEFRGPALDAWRREGVWEPVAWREETILVRDGDPVVDRVPWTRHGPVPAPPGEPSPRSWIPPSAAFRWTAHDGSAEISALLALNRAREPADLEAVYEDFAVPGQNVAFAFAGGTIGIVHAGRFPLRWPEQGRYVGDGADPRFDWAGFVPQDHLPRVLDPPRGYAGSANQPPTDGAYPYWLGWSYGRWERGARIHALLDAMEDVRPEDLLEMQDDTVGLYARTLLPELLRRLPVDDLTDDERSAADDLRAWDHRFRADAIAPTVFDRWQRELGNAVWGDEWSVPAGTPRLPRPRRDVFAATILAGSSAWFDDRSTPDRRETLDDLVPRSFRAALEGLRAAHGPYGEAWRWGRVRRTRIDHVGRLPGLGVGGLAVNGQYGTLRAVTGRAGPSWRMVVEPGDPPRAWGEYPGGQNGDPIGPRYLDGVDAWVRGEVRALAWPSSPDDDAAGLGPRTTLLPAERAP
jgi:penicillin amidase